MMLNAMALKEEEEKKNGTTDTTTIDSPYSNNCMTPFEIGTARQQGVKSDKSSLKKAFQEFTDTTTLHGLRFIFMENAFCFRRFIWFLLVMASAVLLSIQIVERIVFYYSYPMNVNVQVNYNKTLVFPAITICNQNAFRATAATDRGIYRLLECMYDSQCPMNKSVLAIHGAQDKTLETIFKMVAHDKHDLIEGCEWQNELCGPENFTEILTDHGVCYSFNSDTANPAWVTATGSDYGLKLTLNVEQYEYMPGPHSAAGIKMLVHDQKEFPKVAELGLAVPTGSHTFVGIQLVGIENLPKPHGACHSLDSPYYDMYTPDACNMACTTELLMSICKCRHFYMPNINGTPPVCTLEQYYDCYRHNIAYVKARVREQCDCPVPCDFLLYDPTISFATTSVYAVDSLLATTSAGRLTGKYRKALDTTSRMDRLKFTVFETLEEDMRKKFEKVDEALQGVLQKMKSLKSVLDGVFLGIKQVFGYKKYLLSWQEFHVRKNFIRVRNAMEERTLFPLALGFQEFSNLVATKINKLGNNSHSEDVRTSTYLNVKDMLEARIDLSNRAFQNFSQLYDAYYNGTPIFRYKYELETFDDSIFVTPRPLLKNALDHNSLAVRFCARVGDDIQEFKMALEGYLNYTEESYVNVTSDPAAVHQLGVFFLSRGRRFYHSKSTFYAECVEYPQRFLMDRIADMDRRWLVFETDFNSIYNTMHQLTEDLHKSNNSTIKQLQNLVFLSYNFTKGGDVSKRDIAIQMISDRISESIGDLKTIVAKTRSRGQKIYDDWSSLITSANGIWEAVLDDENLEEYYTYKNESELLEPYANVSSQLTKNFTSFRNQSDFRYLLGNTDSLLLLSMESMIDHMKKYYDQSQLNDKFIKDNFLQLDIFYREKSYEQITQQEAYDIFALWCDIGGSMGLFVGASALTICEVLDFGLHQVLYRLLRNFRS